MNVYDMGCGAPDGITPLPTFTKLSVEYHIHICYLLVNHFLSLDMLAWNTADIISREAVRLLYLDILTSIQCMFKYVILTFILEYFTNFVNNK